jgi:hypothetical protein
MPHIGLAHSHNVLKAGSNIKRKAIKRLSDLFVQELNGPLHFSRLYLFCNMGVLGYQQSWGEYGAGPEVVRKDGEKEIDVGSFGPFG